MFVSFHRRTLKRTGADILFFFLYRRRRLSVFLSISNFNFLFFCCSFQCFSHSVTVFFFLLRIFFSLFLYTVCVRVCVRVFKTMIFFFRDSLFRKLPSRKRMSSSYLLRRVRASFEMFGC
jgi:hypothetical protein